MQCLGFGFGLGYNVHRLGLPCPNPQTPAALTVVMMQYCIRGYDRNLSSRQIEAALEAPATSKNGLTACDSKRVDRKERCAHAVKPVPVRDCRYGACGSGGNHSQKEMPS